MANSKKQMMQANHYFLTCREYKESFFVFDDFILSLVLISLKLLLYPFDE